MSDPELQILIKQFDQMAYLLNNLRIIAFGGASILEEKGSSIQRLLRSENRADLCASFNDISTALIWLRDELMAFSLDENLSPSAEPPISL